MIITINDRWRVSSDSLQWILQRRAAVQSGLEAGKHAGAWKPIAFARNLSELLSTMARREIFAIEGEYPPSAILPLCEALDVIKADIARIVATVGANGPCPSTACPMRRRDDADSADLAASTDAGEKSGHGVIGEIRLEGIPEDEATHLLYAEGDPQKVIVIPILKEQDGGPTYYITKRSQLGASLIRTVLGAVDAGELTYTRASRILGVNAKGFDGLRLGTG